MTNTADKEMAYTKQLMCFANAIAYAIETFDKEQPDELIVSEERTDMYIAAAMRVMAQGGVIPALNPAYVTRKQWKSDCDTLMTAWMYGNPPGGWSDPVRIAQFQNEMVDLEVRMRDAAND